MTAFAQTFGEDRVYAAILHALPATRRAGATVKFNCPMCVQRGETPDRRMRGGMDVSMAALSCFNCGFKAGYRPGERLSRDMKEFLAALGIDPIEIARLNHWATMLQSIVVDRPAMLETVVSQPNFKPRALPDGARPIGDWAVDGCTDPNFLAAIRYLYSRGETIAEATTYYWTPNQRYNLHRRIIIACREQGVMVGWIARSISPAITPKYHNATPPALLFNASALHHPKRRIAILLEGVFDALAIDAVGLLGNRLDPRQAARITESGKQIIVVPDRDRAGGKLIDVALDHRWAVAFPRGLSIAHGRGWWDMTIKDTADAVRTYGQLYTLRSILASTTTNRMEISLRRQDFRTPA